VDDSAGTAAVVNHLADNGHDRVAFIGSSDGAASSDRRPRASYAAWLAPAFFAVRT
jgi:DNA-binding LacI/PurR family transcriptional regulator